MKKLILPLILISSRLFADEMIDPNDSKQIVSVVKDLQIEEMLNTTAEFKKCRDKNKFEAQDNKAARDRKIQEAEKCFKEELAKTDDPKKLEKLSEALNLQHYGLVQSKNAKDIQNYLSDKMYKSLTGVDRKEQDNKKLVESLKFKNKKHVDQKVFIDMYKTQLGKNALFEISRFCFENLRSEDSTADNFADHWKDYAPGSLVTKYKTDKINDLGNPKFAKDLSDPEDKTKIYQQIFTSIQGSDAKAAMSDANMSEFFMECGKLIVPLCDKFQKSIDLTKTESQVEAGAASNGAAACLAKSRIQSYKKALVDTEKVVELFKEMSEKPGDLGNFLLKGKPINQFIAGENGNETLDNLTNYTSTDLIEGGYTKDDQAKQKEEECTQKPELSSCEAFLSEGETLDKAKHNVEMEMTLKREVEMARVKKLVEGDKKDLETYLKDNGYIDILKAYEENPGLSAAKIAEMIGTSFEAKKRATLEQINNKLGKRQVQSDAKPTDISQSAKEVIKESKEERARMGQVVLFNNIITSHLTLTKIDASGKSQDAGRNVNAWKKEEDALTEKKVNPELFANLKATTEGVQGMGKDSQIQGFGILDEFLGAQDPNKP